MTAMISFLATLTDLDITGIIFISILGLMVICNASVILCTYFKSRKSFSDSNSKSESTQNFLGHLDKHKTFRMIWYAGLAGTKVKGELDYFDLKDETDPRGATEKDTFPNFSSHHGFILRTQDHSGNKIVVYGEILENLKLKSGPTRQDVIFIGTMSLSGKQIYRSRTGAGDICISQIS